MDRSAGRGQAVRSGARTATTPFVRPAQSVSRRRSETRDSALIELADAGLKNHLSFDAEPLVRECLSIREKRIPDDWLTFNARSRLGGLLLEQKRYAEAEPLLVSGYEGLKQREASIPANVKKRLREAVERLVQFSEAIGKLDEAAKWRKELETAKIRESQPAKP